MPSFEALSIRFYRRGRAHATWKPGCKQPQDPGVQPGDWQVTLTTSDKKTLGIVNFSVVPRDTAEGEMRIRVLKR